MGKRKKSLMSSLRKDFIEGCKKNDLVRLNTIVYVSLEIIRKISILLMPIIPDTSKRSLKSLNINESNLLLDSINNHKTLKSGTKLNNQGILFKKIEVK